MIKPRLRLADTAAIASLFRVAPGTVRYWASVDRWTPYGTRRHRQWNLLEAQASYDRRHTQEAKQMDTDDVRKRLDAVAHIDWHKVEHNRDEEYHGDWAEIGPVRMLESTDEDVNWIPPSIPEGSARAEEYRARQRAEQAEERAVLDFLTNAYDDIRTLLAELERRLGKDVTEGHRDRPTPTRDEVAANPDEWTVGPPKHRD